MTPDEAKQARFAFEQIIKAWTTCREAGVDEHLLRSATLTAAISHMVSEAGPDGAAVALNDLAERALAGEFTAEPAPYAQKQKDYPF